MDVAHLRAVADVVRWCRALPAAVVAVDAPGRWRAPGGPMRAAERELARAGIACFPTPTAERAQEHPFFRWMLSGAELFAALEVHYPLCADASVPPRQPVSVETFPQAVACALRGRIVSAREKRTLRPALLAARGIDVTRLTSIDLIDAALCAVAGQALLTGRCQAYGDAAGGWLVVPRTAAP